MKYEALTEQVISAFYTIYNEFGHGFLESIYQRAFAVLLAERGMPFREQAPIQVVYHGIPLGDFKADLIADDKVLIELKAAKGLEDAHERQVLNYLKSTDLRWLSCSISDHVHKSGAWCSTTNSKSQEQQAQAQARKLQFQQKFRENPCASVKSVFIF